MRIIGQQIESLQRLYVFNLRKALDMELKSATSLTDIAERATDSELKTAFLHHLDETRSHVSRIEGLLRKLPGRIEREDCKTMDELASEASDILADVTDSSVRDIALIAVAQQVEHHEIAVYGALRRWAKLLGLGQDAGILESIEAEESNADDVLSEIAARINFRAAA